MSTCCRELREYVAYLIHALLFGPAIIPLSSCSGLVAGHLQRAKNLPDTNDSYTQCTLQVHTGSSRAYFIDMYTIIRYWQFYLPYVQHHAVCLLAWWALGVGWIPSKDKDTVSLLTKREGIYIFSPLHKRLLLICHF